MLLSASESVAASYSWRDAESGGKIGTPSLVERSLIGTARIVGRSRAVEYIFGEGGAGNGKGVRGRPHELQESADCPDLGDGKKKSLHMREDARFPSGVIGVALPIALAFLLLGLPSLPRDLSRVNSGSGVNIDVVYDLAGELSGRNCSDTLEEDSGAAASRPCESILAVSSHPIGSCAVL